MNARHSRIARQLCAFVISTAAVGVSTAAQTSGGQATDSGARLLEEIIVTAQRREQSVLDAPISITAIESEDLAKRNLVSMEDYLSTVPGVTVSNALSVLNDLTFRGLGGFSGSEATVGVYFGEVPLTSPQSAQFATDVKLVDMARVEVIRGPNGSLYGSSSLSGTLRYIPNAPQLTELSGSVTLGRSFTARNSGENDQLTGVANFPLIEDKLGLRVVGYKFEYGGSYDVVSLNVPYAIQETELYGGEIKNEENHGGVDVEGVRATLLWAPTDSFSTTLMYMYQDVFQDGTSISDPQLGEYKSVAWPIPNGYSPTGREFYRDTLNLLNLVVDYDMGWGTITSSTSMYEGGFARAGVFAPQRRMGKLGQVKRDTTPRESLFEEIRVSSHFNGPLQFTAGYFYQDSEDNDDYNFLWMGSPEKFPADGLRVFTGQRVFNAEGILVYWENSTALEQNAVFGEVYYNFTDALKLTLGGRYFDYKKTRGTGAIHDPQGPIDEATQLSFATSSENGDVLRANLSYNMSDNSRVYAEWGEGFRVGRPGNNLTSGAGCDADGDGILDGTNARLNQDIKSDRTESLEIGAKFRLFHNRLSVNAAVYDIDWVDLPTRVSSPICAGTAIVNAGAARSRGFELEMQAYLTDNLRFDLGGSIINAELTEDDAATGSSAGDQLPLAAELSWRAALEYEFEVAGNRGYLGGDFSRIGPYYGGIGSPPPAYGDYDMVGLHAGMDFGRYHVEIYGTNLKNETAITFNTPWGNNLIRPRVIGAEFGIDF